MPQVISTLTDSVEYTTFHHQDGGGVPEPIKSVLIKGGAKLAQRKLVLLGEGKSSKDGISTEVTDEELSFLQGHPLFQTHLKNGYLEVVKTVAPVDAEKVAKDMAVDKKSAQLTLEDTDDKNPDARLKGHKVKSTIE